MHSFFVDKQECSCKKWKKIKILFPKHEYSCYNDSDIRFDGIMLSKDIDDYACRNHRTASGKSWGN